MSDSVDPRKNPPPQDGSGPDVFRWSGTNDNSNSGQGKEQQGNQRDHYIYDGSGRRSGQDTTAGQDDTVPANWHPDYSLSSPSAQQWFKESQDQRKKPLDVDQNGDYVVKHGDSLWTIAERELHDTGKKGNDQEIQSEINQIVRLNEKNMPSLRSNPDYIRDGWKLHIEPAGRGNSDTSPSSSSNAPHVFRCVPKNPDGEAAPPGYRSRPSVIVNNVYAHNAYFNQSDGPSSDQVMPRRRDLYDCSGDRGGRGSSNNGGDLYNYSGDRGGRGSSNNGGDLYNYSGDRGGNSGPSNNGDLYNYSGDARARGNQGDPNAPGQYNDGQRVWSNYSGDPRRALAQQDNRDLPYNGTYNDGTSYYGGAGSAQDQLHPGGPRRVIINNVYTDNAYFNQSGNDYSMSPQNRIQRGNCSQSGSDNYYNNRGNGYRIMPIPNATPDDGSYIQPIPNARPGDGRFIPLSNNGNTGDGSTDYYTYNGQVQTNNDNSYSSDRSQQGYNVDPRYSTYSRQSADSQQSSDQQNPQQDPNLPNDTAV